MPDSVRDEWPVHLTDRERAMLETTLRDFQTYADLAKAERPIIESIVDAVRMLDLPSIYAAVRAVQQLRGAAVMSGVGTLTVGPSTGVAHTRSVSVVVEAQFTVTAEVVKPPAATPSRRVPRRWLVDLTPDEARFISLVVIIFVAIGIASGALPADFRTGLDEVRDWSGFGLTVATLVVVQNRHRGRRGAEPPDSQRIGFYT